MSDSVDSTNPGGAAAGEVPPTKHSLRARDAAVTGVTTREEDLAHGPSLLGLGDGQGDPYIDLTWGTTENYVPQAGGPYHGHDEFQISAIAGIRSFVDSDEHQDENNFDGNSEITSAASSVSSDTSQSEAAFRGEFIDASQPAQEEIACQETVNSIVETLVDDYYRSYAPQKRTLAAKRKQADRSSSSSTKNTRATVVRKGVKPTGRRAELWDNLYTEDEISAQVASEEETVDQAQPISTMEDDIPENSQTPGSRGFGYDQDELTAFQPSVLVEVDSTTTPIPELFDDQSEIGVGEDLDHLEAIEISGFSCSDFAGIANFEEIGSDPFSRPGAGDLPWYGGQEMFETELDQMRGDQTLFRGT
ncbi:hypothetical protein FOC1_g10010913 [Fusarium oxysporum f. sp. cubense race 1]|uniref:Uncharacterized protein n=1 Tax=Fusarium oxysporum f. sp. cubense (strain race 1) TaxID=1229664 RepID=N4UCC8_FUSC1|nr:hypothetical protein FOC1_g10010913 [Fusarium oxysporum f. sp. cubense race 1]